MGLAAHVLDLYNQCSCGYGLKKLYSFGVLSDVHVNSAVSGQRFKNAIKHYADELDAEFVCISGDMTLHGTPEQFDEYIKLVTAAKKQCNNTIEVHDTTGNHDVQQAQASLEFLQEYANGTAPYDTRELYYSFTFGNDVFIMFGMVGWPGKTGELYSDASMTWLEQTLEANKDKRCFLFFHPPCFTTTVNSDGSATVTDAGSGAVVGYPPTTGTYIQKYPYSAARFKAAIKDRPNLVWLHGHTHLTLEWLEVDESIIHDEIFGCHSIHVPSLYCGRHLNAAQTGWTSNYGEGYGYLVDVYENSIVLRGIDFVTNEFIPIAVIHIDMPQS
jgi:3',5'-cyclic AMP phosphodiesterase CpdA